MPYHFVLWQIDEIFVVLDNGSKWLIYVVLFPFLSLQCLNQFLCVLALTPVCVPGLLGQGYDCASTVFSLQADDLPDIPPQTVTEEQYMDEQGNMVVKKVKGHFTPTFTDTYL